MAASKRVCATCLSSSLFFFEVPDTFKVTETDKERIRNMENEIEKGGSELSRRQNLRKASKEWRRNRTQRKSRQSDGGKRVRASGREAPVQVS